MTTRAKQVDFLLAANRKTDGSVNSGGKVYFWADSGRTIVKDVWDSATKDAVLSQPVTIGVRGTADVFADGTYWITVKDSALNTVDTIDNVSYVAQNDFGGLWVDLSTEYGTTASDLQDAIDDIGASNATILFREGEYTIAADVTVPSNVLLRFEYGAYCTVSAGITLTINGDIEAPYYNIFQGTGTKTIANKKDAKDIWTVALAEIGDVTFADINATTLDVSGAVGIDGDFDIGTNKFTVAAATGNTLIAGTLGVTGDLSINTNKFTVAAATGNTLVAGTLGVTGAITGGSLTDGTATLSAGALTGLTNLTVDNLNLNGNTISSTSGAVNITPFAGSSIVLDSHWGIDGTALTALTDANTTITAYTGKNITIEGVTFDGGDVAGVGTLTATNLAGTLTTAAQGNVTSLGTLTALQVDNLNLNGNTLSSTSGAVNITPIAGSSIVLDSHWGIDGTVLTAQTDSNTTITAYAGKNITIEGTTFDGGVVAGISSLTATNITGTLATAAQGNVTSLGTLTALQVDNLNLNGNTFSSTSGNIIITPIAGSSVILDGHWSFDGNVMTALTDVNTTITAFAGKNVSIEGTTFDGGVVAGISSLTATNIAGTLSTAAQGNITSLGTLTALQVDNLNLNGNTLSTTSGAVTITPLAGQSLNVSLSTTGDFVVNTNQFFVDTSAGFIGIGTSSPLGKLTLASDSGQTVYMDIWCLNSGGEDPILRFGGVASVTTPATTHMKWGIGCDRSNNKLNFLYDGTNGVTTADSDQLMTIDSSGFIGIGTSSPDRLLSLSSTAPTITFVETGVTANNTKWDITVNAEQFTMRLVNDDYSAVQNFLVVDRTANTVDSVFFPQGSIGIGGVSTPAGQVEILAASGAQLVLSQDEGVDECSFTVGANGDLTVETSGDDYIFNGSTFKLVAAAASPSIQVGGNSATGFPSLIINGSAGTVRGQLRYDEASNIVELRHATTTGLSVNNTGGIAMPNLPTTGSGNPVYIDASGNLWENTSSRRFKKDIQNKKIDTSYIYQFQPVDFIYKDSNIKSWGYIAEDIQQYNPELITYENDGKTPKGIDYPKLSIILLEELKNLKNELQELKHA